MAKSAKKKRKVESEEQGEGNVGNNEKPTMCDSVKKNSKKHQLEEESSDTDDDLLQAAAQWAKESDSTKPKPSTGSKGEETTLKVPHPAVSSSSQDAETRQCWSVHITQLSYDATDFDIRQAFANRGCMISSVRLVYDYSASIKTFRGVAFVDCEDQDSYKKALTMDKQMLMGRRINVRPTRTKSELADIVQRTQELVADKMRQSVRTNRTHGNYTEEHDASSGKKTKKRKHSKDENRDTDGNDKKSPSTKNRISESSTGSSVPRKEHTKSDSQTGSSDRKLSKKERNRRAAIIANKRRRHKGK